MVDPMRTALADLADVFAASDEETIQVDLSQRAVGGARRATLARRIRRAIGEKLTPAPAPPPLLRVRALAVLPRQQLIAPMLARLRAQPVLLEAECSLEEIPRP
jgi:hypothetical protein